MDLSYLIPSVVRRQVLSYFCQNQKAQIHIHELARELKQSPQLVSRELTNMENWGFLLSTKKGNLRIYFINQKFTLKEPVYQLFSTLQQDNEREYNIHQVYDWGTLKKKYHRVSINPELKKQLTAKRVKPRAYTEEKFLKQKGLL